MDRGFCQDALPWYVNMLREAQLGEFRKDTLRFARPRVQLVPVTSSCSSKGYRQTSTRSPRERSGNMPGP